jgi:hypothetical protein
MARRRSQWIPVRAALSVAVLAPLVGCSSASTEPHGGPAAGAPSATGAPVAEADRVHAYLEGRYPSSAVRHSFHTTLGQAVDCVDFFQMPGVRAMAARGEPITEMAKPPTPRPRRLRDGSTVIDPPQPAPVSEGVDEDGHERLCPEGTVLQFRVTSDDIAHAGGLDAYQRARQKHAPARAPQASPAASPSAPPTMWPCQSGEFHQYAHVIGDVVDQTPGVVFGMDTMAVYAPSIPQQSGNHTVGQVWMFGGTIAQDLPTDPGCDPTTMDCVQSIEIGWLVDERDFSNAHVFTFSTLDGYTGPSSGCWDGDGSAGCPPFIWSSGYPSNVAPGASIPVSNAYSTPPQELSALIIQIGGDYWVQIGVGGHAYYIGYYPGSNFRGPLSTFQVGGEVSNSQNDFTNPAIPMGSGYPAGWGYGWSAYHHDFNAMVDWNGQQSNYWTASMCASVPPNYSYAPYGYSSTAPPGSSSWTTDGGYFYYGDTPSPCAPTTCAAAGATCGTIADGCGGQLFCGTCPCRPTTCAAAGANCGSIPDGCGNILQCGTCGPGDSCVSNVCECTPRKCPAGTYWNSDDCACERPIKCTPATCQ